MAEFAREMEEFKAANRTFGADHQWKVDNEMKVNEQQRSPLPSSTTTSSNQPSTYNGIATTTTTTTATPKPPPQPTHLSAAAPYSLGVNKYRNYNYNPRVTWSSGNSEMKMKRRVLKYKSYAVEAQLKSSFMDSFRWMKTKYCQIIRGY